MNCVERPLRDHRPVVVGHVLGDGHERRHAHLQDLVQQAEVEREQVAVDLMQQLRLVDEGQHELLESHQRAREPEEPLQRAPHHRLAPSLPLCPGRHARNRRIVAREQLRPDAPVVVHVGDDPLHVMLRRLDGRVGRAEPELLVGVEAEVLGDVEHLAELELDRQALAMPALGWSRSHHMAHSQRGRRSTGWKFMTARKRSTWFMAEGASGRCAPPQRCIDRANPCGMRGSRLSAGLRAPQKAEQFGGGLLPARPTPPGGTPIHRSPYQT